MEISNLSINQVEKLYRQGLITEEKVTEYLKSWNAEPHFSQAILSGGAIRTFDPEKSGIFYRHLQEKFGLIL
jgi:hypothetical protein